MCRSTRHSYACSWDSGREHPPVGALGRSKSLPFIGGAQTIQQCLESGLVDELQLDLVPVLLGGGLRLFEQFASAPIELQRIRVVEYPWFTYLRFRMVEWLAATPAGGTMSELVFSSATQLAAAIRAGHLSAIEVLEAYLAQIAAHNPALNAIVTLDTEHAQARARQADAALARGELWGPLHGVPFTQAPTTLAAYLQALHRRDGSILAWERFFAQWDALLCPPAMSTAFPHCEPGAPLLVDGHEQVYWQVSAYTTLFNYSGHPALVLPYGQDRDGLPVGVQLVGKRWDETRLLGVAQAVSTVTGPCRHPPGY